MGLDGWLKTAHVLGAMLFVGNVIVTGIWSAILFRARHTHDFRVAARAIIVTDWAFTVGGGALLTTSGVWLAMHRGLPIWGTPWIRSAMIALALSTALWLIVLVPAQRTMHAVRQPAAAYAGATDAILESAFMRWTVAGWLATAPLVYAVWCMVTKPMG